MAHLVIGGVLLSLWSPEKVETPEAHNIERHVISKY